MNNDLNIEVDQSTIKSTIDILFENIQVCPIDDHSTMGIDISQVNTNNN